MQSLEPTGTHAVMTLKVGVSILPFAYHLQSRMGFAGESSGSLETRSSRPWMRSVAHT